MEQKVYVLLWNYADKSNFGIIGVYSTKDLVETDMALLEEHGDPAKKFVWFEEDIIGA